MFCLFFFVFLGSDGGTEYSNVQVAVFGGGLFTSGTKIKMTLFEQADFFLGDYTYS